MIQVNYDKMVNNTPNFKTTFLAILPYRLQYPFMFNANDVPFPPVQRCRIPVRSDNQGITGHLWAEEQTLFSSARLYHSESSLIIQKKIICISHIHFLE